MDYDMMFFGRDIDIVCIMHGVYHAVNCYNYYVYYGLYQLLRLLTVIIIVDGHVILSSSVLPLRSLESVVRCSSAVLYTLDSISRYFYAGLDYLFSRHAIYAGHCYHSRTLLPDLDYIMLVEFVERPSSR